MYTVPPGNRSSSDLPLSFGSNLYQNLAGIRTLRVSCLRRVGLVPEDAICCAMCNRLNAAWGATIVSGLSPDNVKKKLFSRHLGL